MARASIAGPKIDGMVRFYKKVQVQNTLEGFQVLLDGKRLKTPLKNVFQVKSRHLAMAVAHEWDNQKEGGLRPASMPLMSFASTVIDGTEHKNVLVDDMMKYFCSDTICFEADEKNSKTVKMQRKLWNPIRKWFTNEFQVPLVVNDGGIGRLPISEESRIKIKAILSHKSDVELIALRSMTKDCKSLILAMALSYGAIDVKEAIAASRVEEESQIKNWGMVEGGHDVDRVNINANVAAANVFLSLYQH